MCIIEEPALTAKCREILLEGLTIVIVFTDEDHWQVPEPSHIEGLKNLALVGCTISIPGYSIFTRHHIS